MEDENDSSYNPKYYQKLASKLLKDTAGFTKKTSLSKHEPFEITDAKQVEEDYSLLKKEEVFEKDELEEKDQVCSL